MQRRSIPLLFLISMTACGSDAAHSADAADHGAAGHDAAVSVNPDAAPAVDANVQDADAPDASQPAGPPTLLSVVRVVHGTFGLSWTLPAGGCTTITVNRNKDGAGYAPSQMVTGVATEVNDLPGHAVGTYCYTLNCTANGVASAPSNERCASQ